ncbi:MAG: NAD(+)/NADH kinase [Oscillospiraceae bacterium]|jgi:NAD+ kinase
MKKITLCTNPFKDIGWRLTKNAYNDLISLGIEVSVCVPDMHFEPFDKPAGIKLSSIPEALSGAELMICFGGDGTILHAAREAALRQIPILGVNLGQCGFMAEISPDEVHLFPHALNGDYTIDERMMLSATVVREGEDIYSELALNDAIIGKGFVSRVVDLSVYSDDQLISSLCGDGVIISTPTGSTAYSMSAGGPVIEPKLDCMLITPICTHSVQARSFVLAPERIVTVRVGELSGKAAYISCDGRTPFELLSGDVIRAVRSSHRVKLLHLKNKSFFDDVGEKLERSRGEKP